MTGDPSRVGWSEVMASLLAGCTDDPVLWSQAASASVAAHSRSSAGVPSDSYSGVLPVSELVELSTFGVLTGKSARIVSSMVAPSSGGVVAATLETLVDVAASYHTVAPTMETIAAPVSAWQLVAVAPTLGATDLVACAEHAGSAPCLAVAAARFPQMASDVAAELSDPEVADWLLHDCVRSMVQYATPAHPLFAALPVPVLRDAGVDVPEKWLVSSLTSVQAVCASRLYGVWADTAGSLLEMAKKLGS